MNSERRESQWILCPLLIIALWVLAPAAVRGQAFGTDAHGSILLTGGVPCFQGVNDNYSDGGPGNHRASGSKTFSNDCASVVASSTADTVEGSLSTSARITVTAPGGGVGRADASAAWDDFLTFDEPTTDPWLFTFTVRIIGGSDGQSVDGELILHLETEHRSADRLFALPNQTPPDGTDRTIEVLMDPADQSVVIEVELDSGGAGGDFGGDIHADYQVQAVGFSTPIGDPCHGFDSVGWVERTCRLFPPSASNVR